MSTIAIRNRAIKKALEQAFGRGNIKVRGSRGTAYGWVHADIAYAPRDYLEGRELYCMVQQLACKAAESVGSKIYEWSNDGSGGLEINISFQSVRNREAA